MSILFKLLNYFNDILKESDLKKFFPLMYFILFFYLITVETISLSQYFHHINYIKLLLNKIIYIDITYIPIICIGLLLSAIISYFFVEKFNSELISPGLILITNLYFYAFLSFLGSLVLVKFPILTPVLSIIIILIIIALYKILKPILEYKFDIEINFKNKND